MDRIFLTTLACVIAASLVSATKAADAAGKPIPWTLDEVRRELALNPGDPYLQYVALQLARRENSNAVEEEIEHSITSRWGNRVSAGRRDQVDVFSIFSGALAVQESLQLDTMRGADRERDNKKSVAISSLKGPEVQSHPWDAMLGNSKPDVSALSHYIPADYYLVEFSSLNKLLETMELKDLWGTHLFSQAANDAKSPQISERLKGQLAIETNPLLRPFYDMIVEEVAVTGSDLFVNEGSDVTLLFQIKQPGVFQTRMDGFLDNGERAHPGAKRETGTYMDVSYVALTTPDRQLNVISAYPAPNLHIRSNSLAAFRHVIETIKGKAAPGALADTKEFQFIRTLMPRGAKEEDGFVYLSDPFIRRQVGPEVKLTELERITCYNHMRMLSHAALLYRTETGQAPESIARLVEAKCLPKEFLKGESACPAGGQYTLTPECLGACSIHGRPHFLTPCCEIPVKTISKPAADDYSTFVNEYNQYWRTYFDPIAVRIHVQPEQLRVETVVLPLIDNSIYTGMSKVFGGATEALDALPVPSRNILTMCLKWNKAELLKTANDNGIPVATYLLDRNVDGALNTKEFIEKGIGNQLALHIYDSTPTFDINVPVLMAQAIRSASGSNIRSESLGVTFLLASLNSPVYASFPVQDSKVVDDFLDKLDEVLVAQAHKTDNGGWFRVIEDAYTSDVNAKTAYKLHTHSIGVEGAKWRISWARIGKGLYVSSKPFVLDDIAALEGNPPPADAGPTGHAMVRVRAEHWKESLPDFRLGWAESNRRACLNNLAPLSDIARAYAAAPDLPADRARFVTDQAQQLYSTRFFCPEGGEYHVTPDGKSVTCIKHGSMSAPRQPLAPEPNSPAAKAVSTFGGMTATLTFMEDGLHAVMTIERKQ
jgi:hypothetical protein